ncbi:acyl-CoA reductase [Mucilaginibacter limnophilus]|uniref:Acyl-CoA reductase n=1 Tax=Mucilaginibacter limnophilus TaxID=1932778 RepID=A0A437MYA7_9SPHI|nr:acyl-CoA reductase [Mucilaginibacter limnophilus]RVU02670.1 acyl-CoA reductase [Mucilaginibacter limnophilus]
MSNYNPDTYIQSFSVLGEHLRNPDEELKHLIQTEKNVNAWFTPESIESAINAIAENLNSYDLTKWLQQYSVNANIEPKNIGLILAGNIPLVGFHDILSVLLSGNKALIKASSQDSRLIKYLLNKLVSIDNTFADRFTFVEKLQNFDAVIATGSDNTSRYFEYYFGKVPHIIRKNRNSISVLTGEETTTQLHELGHDIFDYFGLGCRNVSKLLVPHGYDFTPFFEAIEPYNDIANHNKYHNNYDYNKSIYLVNRDKHLDNGFLLLKEDERLASPLAVLFYEYYDDIISAERKINSQADKIQCVVSTGPLQVNSQVVSFGQSQQPGLADYADGVDTMKFLAGL